jgi:protein tyrosine/serine phosphatase
MIQLSLCLTAFTLSGHSTTKQASKQASRHAGTQAGKQAGKHKITMIVDTNTKTLLYTTHIHNTHIQHRIVPTKKNCSKLFKYRLNDCSISIDFQKSGTAHAQLPCLAPSHAGLWRTGTSTKIVLNYGNYIEIYRIVETAVV